MRRLKLARVVKCQIEEEEEEQMTGIPYTQ
jgi:hypothetical protein